MSQRRKIIHIDEEKCDGCGLCADACAEGAIQIIDGKARLVSETYCDGLGACIGECPRGAITIEEREAAAFDEEAVKRHLARNSQSHVSAAGATSQPLKEPKTQGHVCPGSFAQMLRANRAPAPAAGETDAETARSALGNWPLQLHLVPVNAPYFQGAKLLIAADCVAFAYPDFHRRLLAGKTLLIGCPKLDDVEAYREKMAEILRVNDIESVEVAHMEVPCCFGLVHIVKSALRDAGKSIPLILTKIGIRGSILESKTLEVCGDSLPAGAGR